MICIIYRTTTGAVKIGNVCKANGTLNPPLTVLNLSAHARFVMNNDESIMGYKISDTSELPGGGLAGGYDKSSMSEWTISAEDMDEVK